MEIKRVLNIEDTMLKHMAIVRALEKCRISNVDLAVTAEEGLEKVKEAELNKEPYDLIITDMEFPLHGKVNSEAGMYVIDELKQMKLKTPIAVCSSVRYRIDEIVDCIYYNERSGDLDSDIRELVAKVRAL